MTKKNKINPELARKMLANNKRLIVREQRNAEFPISEVNVPIETSQISEVTEPQNLNEVATNHNESIKAAFEPPRNPKRKKRKASEQKAKGGTNTPTRGKNSSHLNMMKDKKQGPEQNVIGANNILTRGKNSSPLNMMKDKMQDPEQNVMSATNNFPSTGKNIDHLKKMKDKMQAPDKNATEATNNQPRGKNYNELAKMMGKNQKEKEIDKESIIKKARLKSLYNKSRKKDSNPNTPKRLKRL